MRLAGNAKPELTSAAWTRSRASRTALSASPTTAKPGRPSRMSASTHTRRASTPSSAKVTTRAITTGRPSERGLDVVEADEPVARVDGDADRVEAQLGRPGAVRDLAQPGRGHAPDLLALAGVQAVPDVARAEPAGLDLAEDDRALLGIGEHQ